MSPLEQGWPLRSHEGPSLTDQLRHFCNTSMLMIMFRTSQLIRGFRDGNFEAENGPRRCCGERSAYKEHQKWPETEFLRQKRTKRETQRKNLRNPNENGLKTTFSWRWRPQYATARTRGQIDRGPLRSLLFSVVCLLKRRRRAVGLWRLIRKAADELQSKSFALSNFAGLDPGCYRVAVPPNAAKIQVSRKRNGLCKAAHKAKKWKSAIPVRFTPGQCRLVSVRRWKGRVLSKALAPVVVRNFPGADRHWSWRTTIYSACLPERGSGLGKETLLETAPSIPARSPGGRGEGERSDWTGHRAGERTKQATLRAACPSRKARKSQRPEAAPPEWRDEDLEP